MTESTPLLELNQVHTHVGAYHILHGVNLKVMDGKLTMLLGRNGAGKTTTLRTIMGLWRASAGTIDFDGTPIADKETPELARLGIAYVPENMGIFSDLSIAENMTLAARAARDVDALDRGRLDWIFGLFPALQKFWLYPAGLLSGGQKQMLAVARALIEPRRLILVDEPSKGLAPSIVDNLIRAFRELKDGQTTLLLVEQNLKFARELGDSVAVMEDGQIVHQGTMADFAADAILQERLLGLALHPAPGDRA
jgi:branched-chain amino acid transport system ATP-binding protein